jgi:two-component system cell cycle response regulator DivK
MPAEPKTILIVEDNEISMKLVVAVLELGQYRTLSAGDAESGIRLAREQIPDLILMDLQLPGIDGISATAILKADATLRHIPVIALSGYGSLDFGGPLGEIGFSGLITKPIEVRPFLETISGYLGGDPGPLRPDQQ